ncbi:Short-chain dehydrogenase/reductase ATR9 [Fusarium oxysporum f. sp. cubense]|uniref:Short-chain dehydrogenase/reductase ATR9 n=1 Tax=Fusarium oxysporum f. sp. cubense TaxID=61366 RepID=A0A559LRF8_FUSOC|nr:Short-chain dehydrogenase/reductase ATR9 [Fusarium oxysporum f. sp. cubense]
MPEIKNKSILIIGGSSGIGYGVADRALAEGAKVHILSSNPSRLQDSVADLKRKHTGAEVTSHVCDLAVADVEQNIEKVLESIKPIDHIVYTAGDSLPIIPIDQINIEMIHKAGHIRFVVPLLLAKLAPRYLRPGYQSSLTLTSGAGGEKPFPNWSLIAGYLTGLQGLTRNLALDLKPLRVNLVSPGVVDTPLHGVGGVNDEMRNHVTLGKVGTPEEVAEAYIYLMKDTNVTGSCISTNGGSLLL